MRFLILLLGSFLLLASPGRGNGLFGLDDKARSQQITDKLRKYNELSTELATAADQLLKLKNKLATVEKGEATLADATKKLEAATQRHAPETELAGLQSDVEDAKAALGADKSSKDIKASIAELEQTIKDKQTQSASIVSSLTGELSGDQTFKQTTSGYYAILIGIVIVGFFVLAFYDEKVRRAIFSGEAGIQFVTLFALVIAIILFGVTGVLEGKELSALLGGLSGYILGRTRSTSPAGGGQPAAEGARAGEGAGG